LNTHFFWILIAGIVSVVLILVAATIFGCWYCKKKTDAQEIDPDYETFDKYNYPRMGKRSNKS